MRLECCNGDAEADLRASMNRDELPNCLIAIEQSGEPLGTISLKAESISHPHLSPWGAAFVVLPASRRRGVGASLVAFLEEEARLGFGRLYMSTDGATSIVERRGWQAFDTTESLRGTIGVYAIELRDA
jgi:GNAT superfamily N-acetyltransferase